MSNTQIDFENRLAVLLLKKQHGGRRLMERFPLPTQRPEWALQFQHAGGKGDAHQKWLVPVLRHDYDPMYHYQLEKKSRRSAFRGNDAEVREFLMTYSQNNGE
ncbi:hypothetical protein BSR04_09375 [Serratia plymuthica]|nr:hypothetical protein BSR04_09375 [Serratia plymuthica]